MNKSIEVIAKGLEVQVQDKQILGNETQLSLELESGQNLKVLKKLNKESDSFDDLIVVKDAQDLILTYADGSTLTIKGFYSVDDLTLELPTAKNEIHLLSSNVKDTSFSIEYAQGDLSAFESMFEGNELALHHLSEYNNSMMTGLNAGGEATSVEGASGLAGMSTAALVVGGVVVAGGIAAIASSGGSSSSTPTATTSSSSTGYFVDSAVGGVDYYIDGVLKGQTAADGSFSYNEGNTITFKVGSVTVGSIEAADVNPDGTIMPQDLVAGLTRADTDDATVLNIAQLLQTLDADGDASNGIQILKDSEGDIVQATGIDANSDGVVSEAELEAAQITSEASVGTVLLDKDTTLTIDASTNDSDFATALEVAGDAAFVSEADAIAHLNESTNSVEGNDIVSTFSGTVTEAFDITKLVGKGTVVTLTGAASIAEITVLEAITGEDVNYTAVAITDTAANIAASSDAFLDKATTVTASDAATVAQANTIAAFTTSVVYNVSDVAANITAGAGLNEAVNIVIFETAGSLDAAAKEVTDALALTGSDASQTTAVTITGDISVAQANAIDAATAGIVTASISETDATTLLTVADANSNNVITATIDDASVDATALVALNSALTLTVDAKVVTVTETAGSLDAAAKEVTDALALTGSDASQTTAVTITGDISVAQANAIDAATAGIVTASLTISDADVDITAGNNAYTFTITDQNATASDLLAFAQATTINVDATAITTITESDADDMPALIDANSGISLANDVNFVITDGAYDTEAAAILATTTGTLDIQSLGLNTAGSYDLANLSTDVTGLEEIDASEGNDVNISLTAADLFAANDSTGSLSFSVVGTANGNDTLNLSGWTEVTENTQYTITGNFDGVDGDETYTVNVTGDVMVSIA